MKVLLALSALVVAISAHADATFSYTHEGPHITIRLGTQPIATYVDDDPKITRPYFSNIHAPDGTPITRTHPPDPTRDKDNDDHPDYHPGIWLAFGDIGGVDVWRLKGRVRHVEFSTAPTASDQSFSFTVRNAYESLDTPPRIVAEERCTYTFQRAENGFTLRAASEFLPGKEFAFGDQEEMGLGLRLATNLTVKHGGGALLNSEGGKNESGTWGKTATWCAGLNTVNGKTSGAMIVPSPKNFRPSWFHSRDYGLIVANPFGKKAMTAPNDDAIAADATPVKKDDTFSLSFGVYIFSGSEITAPTLEKVAAELAKDL